jgi:uncharacterized membrane protein
MRFLLPALPLLALAGCGSPEPAAAPANAVVAKPIPGPKLGSIELNQPLRAFGTEPFWTLDVAPGDIAFTDHALPDPKPEPFFARSPVVADGKAVWTTKNVADEPVVLTLTLKDCLEGGEPDQTQPFTAELRIGDKVRTGCAGPKPKEVPEGDAGNAADPS